MVADRSAAQITSYISIVTSVGSVIISLLLVRQNRSKNRQSVEEAVSISFDLFTVNISTCQSIRQSSWGK
jgi:hypothetical protein